VAAIGFPARDAGGETFVGVGHAAIVFFAVSVLGRIRIGIAAPPKLLDVLLTFFVGGEAEEGFAFFLGDDVGNLFRQPGGVGSTFLGELSRLLPANFLAERFARRAPGRRLILRAGGFRGKNPEGKKKGKNRPAPTPHEDTSLAKRTKGGDAPIAHLPWPEFRGTAVMAIRIKGARAGCLTLPLLKLRG